MVGESTTVVWDAMKKLAPQLDKLQHKEETIAAEEVADPKLLREKFWTKIGTNLIDLAKSLDSQHQVLYIYKLDYSSTVHNLVGSVISTSGKTFRAG